MGGKSRERSGIAVKRRERIFLGGAKRFAAESGPSTGQRELGQGVPHLRRNASTPSGPAFQFGEEFITLPGPLRRPAVSPRAAATSESVL